MVGYSGEVALCIAVRGVLRCGVTYCGAGRRQLAPHPDRRSGRVVVEQVAAGLHPTDGHLELGHGGAPPFVRIGLPEAGRRRERGWLAYLGRVPWAGGVVGHAAANISFFCMQAETIDAWWWFGASRA